MKQNKLVFGLVLICIILTSSIVLAQEIINSSIAEVRIETTDGRYCIGKILPLDECTLSCDRTVGGCVQIECSPGSGQTKCVYDTSCNFITTNECIEYRCGEDYSKGCLFEYTQPQKEETRTVLLRNPRTAISNVLYASQIFYGLKIKADTLADYYDVVGDTTNAQKYRSVASQFLEVSNMFDALRTKLIQKTVGLADMNELSESDKTEIINEVTQIENKVNQIKEILYG